MGENQWRLIFDAMNRENKSQRLVDSISEGGLCVEVLYLLAILKDNANHYI